MKFGRRQVRLARTALALRPKQLPIVEYARRKELPEAAAIYMAIEKGLVVYVGQTVNLRRRWIYHQLNYHPCTIQAVKIAYLCETDKFNRELLESLLIDQSLEELTGDDHREWTDVIAIEEREAQL